MEFVANRRLGVCLAVITAGALLGMNVAHAQTLSTNDHRAYHAAFADAQKNNWKGAAREAATARDPLPREALHWLAIIRGANGATFGEITHFIATHADWPGQLALEQAAEEAMNGVPDGTLDAWFATHSPITVAGKLRQADVWIAAGRTNEAQARIRTVWINSDVSAFDEQSMYQRYHDYLRVEDHEQRLDRLLWSGQVAAAQRMLPLVPPNMRAVAEARVALMTFAGNADSLVDNVPPEYRDDAGLLYDRIRWRRIKNLDEGALDLLIVAPPDQAHATQWANERQIMARRALAMGRPDLAFRVAEQQQVSSGQNFADLEFLSGWIALRFLHQPDVAYAHFVKLYNAGTLPITIARGAYWAARAADAMDYHQLAAAWFDTAAERFTTYYGQLAASMPGVAPVKGRREPQPSVTETNAFTRQELVRLTRDLGAAGADEVVTPFFRHLLERATTPDQYMLMARLAHEIDRPDLEIEAAKRASYAGVNLIAEGYPIPPLPKGGNVEAPLLLAMTRQESAFAHEAISRVGARGLMQLMPHTASLVAKALHLRFSQKRLTTDRGYNVTLGRAYLDQLLAQFSGSYVLAIAAYNAGPSHVKEWMSLYGDPRADGVNVIDWIESIPYSETRNYVQRVLENLQIYRMRLGQTGVSFTLASDLKR
ncbi:MAG: lytic transglycosylase domain-containing protein [Stellaceae bacterium]